MSKFHINKSYYPIYISSILLSFLLFAMISPITPKSSYATDEITREINSNINIYAHSAVAVSLQPVLDIDVFPETSSNSVSQPAQLTVATNNITGYTIYLRTTNDTNNLISPDNANVIHSIASESALADFQTNSWGFNFSKDLPTSESIYSPIPMQDQELTTTTTMSNHDVYNLNFGTKIDLSLPAGQYSGSVTISVVANPMIITSLSQLKYMQDMTSDICTATPVGTSNQLLDIRDGRSYWVTKMADNNCWMAQNLALEFKDFGDGEGMRSIAANGSAGAILTNGNTDITTGSWQGMQATKQSVPSSITASATNTSNQNLGKYVLADPTNADVCSDVKTNGTLAACTSVGFVDVSNDNWHPGFRAQLGTWQNRTEEELITVSPNNPADLNQGGTYDEHYLVGNYYTFNTATAGTGGAYSNTSGNASSSICPKNWQLPIRAGEKSYANLLSQYGITNTLTGTINDTTYNVAGPPFFFVRSGEVYNPGGQLRRSGANGLYWTSSRSGSSSSSTAVSDYNVTSYNLGINPTSAAPSSTEGRWLGLSVRCVAR